MDRSSLENINEENSQDDNKSQKSTMSFRPQEQQQIGADTTAQKRSSVSILSGQERVAAGGGGSRRKSKEDPIDVQMRTEMEQQLQQFQQKKKLEDGQKTIERAQQLVQQINKQARKQGIDEDDNEKQKYYQQLIRKKREYEDEYMKKAKEFHMTEAMDMDKIQNFIIENFQNNLQAQRQKQEEEIKERENMTEAIFAQNKKLFPQRLPQVADIRSHFFRQSKEIFHPIKQIEIKQLYNEIKEKQKTYDVQEYMEQRAMEKLEDQYYKAYFDWSKEQPRAEDQRNRVRELFVDCFELASTLNNQPESLDKPAIWHSLQFNEKEKKMVDQWMEKKNLVKTNKYGFLEDEQEADADDILKKVEKYLDADLFVQQEDADENVSDDEMNKLKKQDDEPYNENTLENYDNQQESENDN